MSIRVLLVWIYVLVLSVYAWRGKWFTALCGAILMMGAMQHPDMPKNMLAIQGLNPWNILMASVVLVWWSGRRAAGLEWDLPKRIRRMGVAYCLVILWSFFRLWLDRGAVHWALASVLGFYLILALQVIKKMPRSYAVAGDALNARAAKILVNDMGWHRVNLSMMLSGACWAMLSTLGMVLGRLRKGLVVVSAALIALEQDLTGRRTGYETWGLVGVTLSILRWRRWLLLIPAFLPGVAERVFMGIMGTERATEIDIYTMTSGRNLAWPLVIAKIRQSPVLGIAPFSGDRELEARRSRSPGKCYSGLKVSVRVGRWRD